MKKIEEIKCENCICNLPICKAECCQLIPVRLKPHETATKGKIIRVPLRYPDEHIYMLLHGARIVGKFAEFRLENFKRVGKEIHILNRCKMLNYRNMCQDYEHRPSACRELTKDTPGEHGRYTENCIYKKMYEESHGKPKTDGQEV